MLKRIGLASSAMAGAKDAPCMYSHVFIYVVFLFWQSYVLLHNSWSPQSIVALHKQVMD